jgi:hydroxymethylglutaryl-CoA synthase
MERLNLQPRDVSYFVSHQPNIRFPVKVARELGFRQEQYEPGLQVAKFGNTYSGASPVGLAAVLDRAKPNERIIVVSYGSGAGSDAYSLITTGQIEEKRRQQKFTIQHQVENKYIEYVDYDTYRKLKLGL